MLLVTLSFPLQVV